MKKFVLSMAGLLMASVAPSFAALVQFDTFASELCVGAAGCGVQSQVIGGATNGVTITYVPGPVKSGNANPTASPNFGRIWLQCNDGTTTCGTQSLNGLQLYLNFNQILPESGSGSISSTSIVGSIGGDSGSAVITWSVPSTTINTAAFSITYRVTNNPLNITNPSSSDENILPISSLGRPGVTTIQGEIRDNMIPEPSTYALIGGALLGLGMLRRKK